MPRRHGNEGTHLAARYQRVYKIDARVESTIYIYYIIIYIYIILIIICVIMCVYLYYSILTSGL